jgi:hypothetical protein
MEPNDIDGLLRVDPKVEPDPRTFSTKETADGAEVLSISDRVKTVDDAIRKGEFDTAVWYVHSSECTSWECCLKNAEGKPEVVPLWRIKLSLRRRVTRNEQREAEGLLERIRERAPQYPALGDAPSMDDPHLVELSLMDVHFGKLAWRHETGKDYDLAIARRDYIAAIHDLVRKASAFQIERFLLPIGNDFMHVDTQANTTTKGTPVDADGRYPKIWETAKMACVEAIETLLPIAPVDILWVPGNHDQQASFHLCEVLGAWFRNADRFTYAKCDEFTGRKYYPYGPMVIGFTHGDEEKQSDLPAIMMHEARELMATRRGLEIHLGHFHKAKETRYVNTDTFAGGVRVRVLPSLSGTDKWHHAKGYVGSMRAAEAYLWSKRTGYVGHFSANVDMNTSTSA